MKITDAKEPLPLPTVETKENCRVNLETDQLLEAGRELANSQAELHQLEDDFKSVRDEWKSRISSVEARITTVAGRISRGYDIKPVSCTITLDMPEPGMKSCHRNDTGERVWVREMTDTDKQMLLDLETEAEAGADQGQEGGAA